jgi:hypothetical protein
VFSLTNATRESLASCSCFISFSDLKYAASAFSKVSLSEISSSGSSYKSQILTEIEKRRKDKMKSQVSQFNFKLSLIPIHVKENAVII